MVRINTCAGGRRGAREQVVHAKLVKKSAPFDFGSNLVFVTRDQASRNFTSYADLARWNAKCNG
jgi:hypothetical protein